MVIPGRIKNGVVVLDGDVALPEGAVVTVVVRSAPIVGADTMSEEERRRIRQIMDRIAALPDENPGDTFSGEDHDKVLYGMP